MTGVDQLPYATATRTGKVRIAVLVATGGAMAVPARTGLASGRVQQWRVLCRQTTSLGAQP